MSWWAVYMEALEECKKVRKEKITFDEKWQ